MLSAVARRRLKYVVAGSAVGGGAFIYYNSATPIHHEPVSTRPPPPWTPPSRQEMLNRLKQGEKEEFDLLIVGGGATGAGIAVDAATRGLKVALVERDDFSSGTFYSNAYGPFPKMSEFALRLSHIASFSRHLFQVHETRSRWSPLPRKSFLGA